MIEIEHNRIVWTGDASVPGARESMDVKFSASIRTVGHLPASPFVARLTEAEELRALRAMVKEMADLILEQKAEIEELELDTEEDAT